jgi:RNA polymerase sigma-70 factor (ECF subfamily)
MLRTRRSRREEFVGSWMPEPIVTIDGAPTPEEEALIADGVGLALYIVLETLAPAERLAFVLHDMFAMPFDEIAPIVGRTPEAARQLASRGRRRVKGAEVPEPDPDFARQREVVDAFLAAARAGEFERLVGILDPDVVLRGDFGAGRAPRVVRGAAAVIDQARVYGEIGGIADVRRALVNGLPGGVIVVRGRPFAVMAFTVRDGLIVEIDAIQDTERVERIAAAVLADD